MPSIALPPTFPIVGLPLAATFALNMYQILSASAFRKAAGVKYPAVYAPEAEAAVDFKKMKFNCAQRAHANTLEFTPFVLALFGYLSVFHPIVASVGQTLWVIGRIGYTRGYHTGTPGNRINLVNRLSWTGIAVLFFGTIVVSVQQTYALLK
ncbi:hypothetical protein IAR50_006029 [Cryptococcus sp. DSM 104548]